jgi:predicted ATPase
MLTEIKLTNFKCFKEETAIPLSKFNLFTGVNGAGKSTALQSLLLMRQSIEHNPYTTELILNGSCVNFGSFDDVRNNNTSKNNSIFFEFLYHGDNDEEGTLSMRYHLDKKSDEMSLIIPKINIYLNCLLKEREGELEKRKSSEGKIIYDDKSGTRYLDVVGGPICERGLDIKLNNPPLDLIAGRISRIDGICYPTIISEFNSNVDNIHFISADRIGPQEFYLKLHIPTFIHVGIKGESTVSLLNKIGQEIIDEPLCLGDDSRTLLTQTEAWLSKILNADIKLKISPLKVNILELLINDFKPSNVGFGYSSILPIIVTGLIAKPNEKIIIENPEIHLHPKAQSALIDFLVKVANTGVQIFIESHSDHIINGILVQCKKFEESPENGISKDDVSLLYFDKDESGKSGKATKINIEENGRIRYTPKGFFDQFTIDRKFLMGF